MMATHSGIKRERRKSDEAQDENIDNKISTSQKKVPPDDDDYDWVGPLPTEASEVPSKKKKVLEFEQVYLDQLPSAEGYERSYMHRDVVTHVVCSRTGFLITASCDGHVKFWKKDELGIEFVKHFRAHIGNVQHMSENADGALLNTVSNDKSLKVFDIVNFDMINMMRLGFTPLTSEWIHSGGDAIASVAVSDKDSGKIYIFDGRGAQEPIHCLEKLHSSPVCCIRYNPVYEVIVSTDARGMLEYWTRQTRDYAFPGNVLFKFKTDTDLYELAKNKTQAMSIAFSPNGKLMAITAKDHKVRVFKFLTGKLTKVLNEDVAVSNEVNAERQVIPTIEFGRRVAIEKDIDRTATNFAAQNIVFDASGHFVLYATLLGIKVINLTTNRCARLIGRGENARFLQLALFQGAASPKPGSTTKGGLTVEMQASDNPALQSVATDPTLFATGYKKNRFYLFSRREPPSDESAAGDRDVFNEKPSKEDIIAATETGDAAKKLAQACVIHTTMGDIHAKLFLKECPKTVENFCVHARNGYYNGHVFHRVIRSFMVQTGDPTGTGTGGESIWGGEFEDEFHPTLRHDRPYTLSMANAGPNTNGSQFFITVVPCPWLDNKHTVFGRVTKGLEVVQNINSVKTHPKTDKPYEDISIVSITTK